MMENRMLCSTTPTIDKLLEGSTAFNLNLKKGGFKLKEKLTKPKSYSANDLIGLLGEATWPNSYQNADMKKPPKRPSKVIQGQFVNHELDKDELEKAKRMARRIVKRNKRLGDLLGQ